MTELKNFEKFLDTLQKEYNSIKPNYFERKRLKLAYEKGLQDGKEQAIAAWNTRPEDGSNLSSVPSELEKILKEIDEEILITKLKVDNCLQNRETEAAKDFNIMRIGLEKAKLIIKNILAENDKQGRDRT